MTKLENYLQSIFDYYKIKYHFDADLEFITDRDNCWSYKHKIEFSYNYLKFMYHTHRPEIIKRHGNHNLLKFCVIVLLHEIKHLIDNKKHLLEYERSLGDCSLPHDEQPCEKRADFFANIEIKQWL